MVLQEDLKEFKKKVLHTGTTTIGIVCKDGIVLGADKRATLGEGIFIGHKRVDKVLPVTDKITVTTAGSVSDIQLIVKLMKAELKLKQLRTREEPSVKEAANLFGMMVYENIRKFSPILGVTDFLVGGVDSKGFWLFEVGPDGSTLRHDDFVSSGSGMVVAYGVLEDSYKRGMSTDEGVRLVVKALNAAMQRDTPSGSGIDVIVIDNKGSRKAVSEEIKQTVIRRI